MTNYNFVSACLSKIYHVIHFRYFTLNKAINSAIMKRLRAQKLHFILTISFYQKTNLQVLYNKLCEPDLKKS